MADEKLFKELEIGFREIFRIIIPGAYFLSLTQVVASHLPFSKLITTSTAAGLAATFFLGLIGYALRAHERWFPYFRAFEVQRASLNNEIARITELSNSEDNVSVYKYFLETGAAEFSDRIHYFSSFYYMLIELSLFSGAAAYFMITSSFFDRLRDINKAFAYTAVVLVGLACVIQLGALFFLTSVRTLRSRMVLYCDFGLSVAAIVCLVIGGVCSNIAGAAFRAIGWTPLLLLILCYLFWRLGEKHWQQIVGEQLVLVNVKADKLREAATKYVRTRLPPTDNA